MVTEKEGKDENIAKLPADQVYAALGSNIRGLNQSQVAERQKNLAKI